MKRYQWVVGEIEQLVSQGVLHPGEKAPSVRHASAQFGVSKSTVSRAYTVLEQRGELVPKSRSGYYLSQTDHVRAAKPRPPGPLRVLGTADSADLIFDVISAINRPSTVPLGSPFPSPELLPLRKFSRLMAHTLETLDLPVAAQDLPPGNPLLIQQIARRYLDRGYHVLPDEIVITSGALEALNLCINAVTRPGDAVAIESPAFYVYRQAAQRLGLRAVEIPMDPSHGLQLERLERAIKRHAIKAVMLMTSFQNPLGGTLSDAAKRELLVLLSKYGIPLIEDDVYAELPFDGVHRKAAKAHDQDGLVMHCSSFTKWLSPGRRVGWVSAGRYAKKVRDLKLMTTLSSPPFAQAAIHKYLVHGPVERDLHDLRQTLSTNLRSMVEEIGAHFPVDTHVSRPDGGYLLWVELPRGTDVMQVYEQALAEGISIAPGPIFSASHGYSNCMRLNFGLEWDERVQTALRRVGELAKRQLAKKAV